MAILVENIDTTLLKYSNDHAIRVYAPKILNKGSGSTPSSNNGANSF
jgi:hypothetical protein